MPDRSFYILCEDLRPYIQKQRTQFQKPIYIYKNKQPLPYITYQMKEDGKKQQMHLALLNQQLMESIEALSKLFQSF